MRLHRLNLIAPNSLPIVGIKLADDSLASFEYSFEDLTQTSTYIIKNRGNSPLGEKIFWLTQVEMNGMHVMLSGTPLSDSNSIYLFTPPS